jgi:hypothetical protein
MGYIFIAVFVLIVVILVYNLLVAREDLKAMTGNYAYMRTLRNSELAASGELHSRFVEAVEEWKGKYLKADKENVSLRSRLSAIDQILKSVPNGQEENKAAG